MLVELSTDVTDKIFTICNEWGIDVEEFIQNHIYTIFLKYQFMFDNAQNRKIMNDDIINYIDNEFLPVKRNKKLKDIGIL